MDTSKFVIMLTSLVVMALLVGAVFLPVVSSSTTRTVTTIEENEEPGWLKFGYSATDNYNFNVEIDGDNLTVGTQTGELYDMMVLSTDALTIVVDGDTLVAITENGAVDLGTSATVTKTSSGLTVGDTTYSAPLWSYYPNASGKYAYFDHADLLTDDAPLSTWGNFAGVHTYNGIDSLGIGLTLDATVTDGVIEGAVWNYEPEEVEPIEDIEPFNPGSLNPLDPSIIDNPFDPDEPSAEIQSADPTTGTRIGDLYYTFSGTDATVIGYASTIDWSTFTTIPDTVVNNGITYTIKTIRTNAFWGCSSLNLTSLPDGITNIGTSAFQNCTSLALTSLPESVTFVYSSAFQNCTSLRTIVIYGNPSINSDAFAGCSLGGLVIVDSPTFLNYSLRMAGISEVLNLGESEITTTTGGMSASEVRTNIEAVGYIAPLSLVHTEYITIESPTTDVINILPLVAGIGLLLVALGVFITRRI